VQSDFFVEMIWFADSTIGMIEQVKPSAALLKQEQGLL